MVDYGSEKYIQWRKFVKCEIKQDRPDLVQYVLDNGFTNLNLILRKSAWYGNLEYVNKYLYLDYHDGANGPLRGGNKKLFDYIRQQAGEKYILKWQKLLDVCIQIDNQTLFDYIIKLVPSNSTINLHNSLYTEIKTGNKKLYEHVLSIDNTLKNNLYNIRIK